MSASTGTDPIAEVRRLRRQLARERARRQVAEAMGERATADLTQSVRQLRSAQVDLLERDEHSRWADDLALALRNDLDSARLVSRAAESVGRATGVDRCDVLLVDADLYTALEGTWSSCTETEDLPRPHSFVELPEAMNALLLESAQRLAPLQVDHVEEDARLGPCDAAEIVEALGVRALAAVPVALGDEVVGWLLMQSVQPRSWHPRELAIGARFAHDLVTSLIQVRAFEHQRESVRRLEELDRAKDAFISTTSHELRTPLTSIIGYLEMLSEGGMGPIDDGVSRGVAIIERNVERLQDLVEDLLALSAYDAEEVRLDLQPTDLVRVVQDCRSALGPAIEGKSIQVVVVAGSGLPPALADATHIGRLVLNLIANAIKFSHDGAVVTVRLAEEGEHVVLRVSDTGIGIPVGEQEWLFSRFFRSSLAVADEIQGTGLGLPLVRAIAEWHHGTVEVDSVEAQGTTVTVRLPKAS